MGFLQPQDKIYHFLRPTITKRFSVSMHRYYQPGAILRASSSGNISCPRQPENRFRIRNLSRVQLALFAVNERRYPTLASAPLGHIVKCHAIARLTGSGHCAKTTIEKFVDRFQAQHAQDSDTQVKKTLSLFTRTQTTQTRIFHFRVVVRTRSSLDYEPPHRDNLPCAQHLEPDPDEQAMPHIERSPSCDAIHLVSKRSFSVFSHHLCES